MNNNNGMWTIVIVVLVIVLILFLPIFPSQVISTGGPTRESFFTRIVQYRTVTPTPIITNGNGTTPPTDSTNTSMR